MALHFYAMDHEGKYPSGGKTPEASLAMLFPEYAEADVLRGKTVRLRTTEQMLKKQKTLTPESCGWHYVKGFTENDDPTLAVAWDKVGLGHFGQRLRSGGHEVIYVDGSANVVSGPEWPGFLERQKQLLEKRTPQEKMEIPALTAELKLPDGTIVDHYDGAYILREDFFPTGSSSRVGPTLARFNLRWYRIDAETITRTLTLPSARLRSKPVKVEFQNDKPTTIAIIFEMEKY